MAWVHSHNHHSLSTVSIPVILNYLFTLKTLGLDLNSISMQVAAFRAFLPPVDSASMFTHHTTVRFMKGLFNIFPPALKPMLPWDHNLILSTLT